MKQLKKTILTLVALLALTTQAWAMWTGGTYTATGNEVNWNSVNVTDDATLTINQDVSVTTGSISISAGKTLTVVGPGHLVVNRGITGSGTIIVKGNASLLVYGADGSEGDSGYDGSAGGDGAAAIMCSITIYSGTIQAIGGDGGDGGNGDDDGGSGGDGGNGAPAFGGSGTLTYYGGSIEAISGSGGNAGEGSVPGESSEEAMAFADTYNVVFENQPTSIKDDIDDPIDINNIKGAGYIEILGDDADAVTGPTGPEVAWDKTTKTGTFTQPAGNVTVSVEYFPQATADGAVTAATDAKATTDAPLVTVDATQLTGAAKMMYYASTESTAPAYDAEGWTDKVPTAENFTEAGNVNVWYYPVGTDEGVGGATATYSDGDMNATALAVTLGAAPTYNVTFNTEGLDATEAAKWSADPNTGLTKGTEVTVTYTGTRKVIGVKAEKKGGAAAGTTLASALENGATIVINFTYNGANTCNFTNNNGTFTFVSGTGAAGNTNGPAKELTIDGDNLVFKQNNTDNLVDLFDKWGLQITFNTKTNTYIDWAGNKAASMGAAFTSIIVNGVDITDQLTKQ